MPGELDRETITVAVRILSAAARTGRSLKQLLMAALRTAEKTLRTAGQLSLSTVDRLSRSDPISARQKIRNLHLDETQTVSGEDVRQLRREFNRNNVNFAVKRSPTKGEYLVFFNAQDSNRMRQSFENVLAKQAERAVKSKRPPMKERLAAAEKEASRREAARAQEKAVERAVNAPAKEAR